MECQKIINLLENTSNQPSKFRTKNWIEIIDQSYKSKGLSNEIIKPPATSDSSLAPALRYNGNKSRVKFDGVCLKQDKITFTHRTIVNIDIVYEISFSDYNNNYPTLENSLYGAVKLTQNADFGKYKYSAYGIGFDRRKTFSFPTV